MVDTTKEYDRDTTSILTDTYLNYLDPEVPNPKSYESNPSQFKKRMRERIARGLEDLGLLFEFLDAEELQRIFDHYPSHRPEKTYNDDGTESWNYAEAMGGLTFIRDALAFLLWATSSEGEPAFDEFERMLQKATRKYLEHKQDLVADVKVTIEIDNVQSVADWLDDVSPE